MGLMMIEELVRDLIASKCSYEQIVSAVRVRKPLGEDVTNDEMEMIRTMIDKSKVKQARLSSELLGEYYNELESLDWFYDYSDDHRVWKEGSVRYASARNKKYESEESYRLWNDYVDYINGKRTKPEREDYVGVDIH